MAPRRQPRSLYQQCVSHLSHFLDGLCATHIHAPDHPELIAVASYFDSLLPMPLQASVGEALLAISERLQITPSPSHVRLLLRLRVRRLSTSGSVVQSGVLETADGSCLENLSLFYGGCGDRATKLYTFLHTATNLTYLSCTDFCNNHMIDIVARTCEHLYCIDLRGCYDVNDDGVLRLCGLQDGLRANIEVLSKGGILEPVSRCARSLKEIKFSMTKVTEAGVAVILLVFTNIEILRVPDIKMEKVFNFLQTLDHKNVQCNLKEFHSREILNEFQLTVLASLCPNLEYIQVSFIGNSEMDLSRLQQLARLQKLKRAKFADVNCDALVWFLQQVGNRMTHLFLYTYHTRFSQQKLSITRNHLQCLAKFCPCLESLCLDGYLLGEDIPYRLAPENMQYFEALRSLQVASMKLSEDDLNVFLKKCQNMRILELVLQNPHVLYDRLICELLDAGVWQNLIKIRVLNSPLTSKVMNRLVRECPLLQEVGCLYTWLVSKEQVSEFKESIKHQNFDIEIY
ncbi:hypothetical protein OTU49_016683 [Cherax quadricarinatus]|uniref:Uncharacterized protein n=1 Tax=Cherax quadricarinatus TaxID=27406 RepID=A0AAW0YPE7_CHEQU|nr:uncharacterized protein LOC128689702 [Cherax quadricarinatus]XP_053634073.1 uncharacterized protein LOC128689702 [Cherax quadricarinatus]